MLFSISLLTHVPHIVYQDNLILGEKHHATLRLWEKIEDECTIHTLIKFIVETIVT